MPAETDSSSSEHEVRHRKHKHKRRSRSESPAERRKRHKHHKHKSDGTTSDSPHSRQRKHPKPASHTEEISSSEEDHKPKFKREPREEEHYEEGRAIKREPEDRGYERPADGRRREHERERFERRPIKKERWDRPDNNGRNDDDRSQDRMRHRDQGTHSRDRNNMRDQRDERRQNDRRREDRRQNQDGNPFQGGSNSMEQWGQQPSEEAGPSEAPKEKEKPSFELSGKLTEETNTYRGIVIKYNEPPEARKPKKRWRLYPFKGDDALPVLHIHRQSAFLLGRERLVADIPVDHPSCSKQHAVLQYRLVSYQRDDGSTGQRVKPYIIDLGSANGTFLNNQKLEPERYVELREKDVLKFGFSSREYVLLHEGVDTADVLEEGVDP